MVKQFLITRPYHDKETSYLYSFSKAIVAIVRDDKNIRLTALEGSDAVRINLEKILKTKDWTLVFLNGHGDENTVFGHDDEPILDKDNVSLTQNQIVYALACNSLERLGKLAITKGTKAYIGYRDKFMFVGDPTTSAVPDKDKNAAPFRQVCHFLIKALVEGESVGDAIDKTKSVYERLIRTYGTSEDSYGDAPAIGLALSWDMCSLDCEGDTSAAFWE